MKERKKDIYTNDRTAPRMKKGEFSSSVVTKELFAEFKKSSKEYKKMKWEDFFAMWQDIAETIRTEAITNPLGVKLGGFAGELKYQYLPYKYKAVDIGTSTEIGEKLNFVNLTTKGKVGIVKWERRWAVKFNKMLQFYAFVEHREMKDLSKKYTDEHPDKIRIARNTLKGPSVWKTKPK